MKELPKLAANGRDYEKTWWKITDIDILGKFFGNFENVEKRGDDFFLVCIMDSGSTAQKKPESKFRISNLTNPYHRTSNSPQWYDILKVFFYFRTFGQFLDFQ